MPFGSIGLTRTDVFLARYDIAKTQDNFVIEALVDEDKSYTRALTMKGKGIKIDYRCGDPTKIKAPRQVNDTLVNQVALNAEGVLLLQKGLSAMGSEQVAIVCDNDGVSFELTDVNNDVFKHTFASEAVAISENERKTFAHKYPAKILLALFKHDPTGSFKVGTKGILSFPVNGLTVFVLPQV
jgi:hypothetical protein